MWLFSCGIAPCCDADRYGIKLFTSCCVVFACVPVYPLTDTKQQSPMHYTCRMIHELQLFLVCNLFIEPSCNDACHLSTPFLE